MEPAGPDGQMSSANMLACYQQMRAEGERPAEKAVHEGGGATAAHNRQALMGGQGSNPLTSANDTAGVPSSSSNPSPTASTSAPANALPPAGTPTTAANGAGATPLRPLLPSSASGEAGGAAAAPAHPATGYLQAPASAVGGAHISGGAAAHPGAMQRPGQPTGPGPGGHYQAMTMLPQHGMPMQYPAAQPVGHPAWGAPMEQPHPQQQQLSVPMAARGMPTWATPANQIPPRGPPTTNGGPAPVMAGAVGHPPAGAQPQGFPYGDASMAGMLGNTPGTPVKQPPAGMPPSNPGGHPGAGQPTYYVARPPAQQQPQPQYAPAQPAPGAHTAPAGRSSSTGAAMYGGGQDASAQRMLSTQGQQLNLQAQQLLAMQQQQAQHAAQQQQQQQQGGFPGFTPTTQPAAPQAMHAQYGYANGGQPHMGMPVPGQARPGMAPQQVHQQGMYQPAAQQQQQQQQQQYSNVMMAPSGAPGQPQPGGTAVGGHMIGPSLGMPLATLPNAPPLQLSTGVPTEGAGESSADSGVGRQAPSGGVSQQPGMAQQQVGAQMQAMMRPSMPAQQQPQPAPAIAQPAHAMPMAYAAGQRYFTGPYAPQMGNPFLATAPYAQQMGWGMNMGLQPAMQAGMATLRPPTYPAAGMQWTAMGAPAAAQPQPQPQLQQRLSQPAPSLTPPSVVQQQLSGPGAAGSGSNVNVPRPEVAAQPQQRVPHMQTTGVAQLPTRSEPSEEEEDAAAALQAMGTDAQALSGAAATASRHRSPLRPTLSGGPQLPSAQPSQPQRRRSPPGGSAVWAQHAAEQAELAAAGFPATGATLPAAPRIPAPPGGHWLPPAPLAPAGVHGHSRLSGSSGGGGRSSGGGSHAHLLPGPPGTMASLPPSELKWLEVLTTTDRFFKVCKSCGGGLRVGERPSNGGRDALATLMDLDDPESEGVCTNCRTVRDALGHRLLQIRRSTYHDVVKAQDLTLLRVDLTGVQAYSINNSRVVFLQPRPATKPPKGSSMPSRCILDGRQLMDAGSKYCSLRCKLDVEIHGVPPKMSANPNDPVGSFGPVGGPATALAPAAAAPARPATSGRATGGKRRSSSGAGMALTSAAPKRARSGSKTPTGSRGEPPNLTPGGPAPALAPTPALPSLMTGAPGAITPAAALAEEEPDGGHTPSSAMVRGTSGALRLEQHLPPDIAAAPGGSGGGGTASGGGAPVSQPPASPLHAPSTTSVGAAPAVPPVTGEHIGGGGEEGAGAHTLYAGDHGVLKTIGEDEEVAAIEESPAAAPGGSEPGMAGAVPARRRTPSPSGVHRPHAAGLPDLHVSFDLAGDAQPAPAPQRSHPGGSVGEGRGRPPLPGGAMPHAPSPSVSTRTGGSLASGHVDGCDSRSSGSIKRKAVRVQRSTVE